LISQVQHHTMEVCGLKWASGGRFLASGGNDNEIFIWNLPTSKEPVNKLSEHTSAVKVFVYAYIFLHILLAELKFWCINLMLQLAE